MREINRWQRTRSFVACVGVGLALGAFAVRVGAAPQTSQSKTEIKSFEVISVDGNKVVIKEATGAREVTVPNDFTVDVGGKKVGVHELKPGMKGTATITTTMTEHKVYVTEVKSARIHQIVGGNIIVMIKGETSYRMFTQNDAAKKGRTILQDGKPLDWETLKVGNVITATIVTEGPPQVLTDKQVEVKMAEAAKAVSAPVAPAPAKMSTSSAPPTGGSSAAVGTAPATTATPAAAPAKASPAPASTPAAAPSGAASTEPPAAPNAIPAAETTVPAEESGWNPLVIGGIAVVLIVALVMFLAMRKKEEEKAR